MIKKKKKKKKKSIMFRTKSISMSLIGTPYNGGYVLAVNDNSDVLYYVTSKGILNSSGYIVSSDTDEYYKFLFANTLDDEEIIFTSTRLKDLHDKATEGRSLLLDVEKENAKKLVEEYRVGKPIDGYKDCVIRNYDQKSQTTFYYCKSDSCKNIDTVGYKRVNSVCPSSEYYYRFYTNDFANIRFEKLFNGPHLKYKYTLCNVTDHCDDEGCDDSGVGSSFRRIPMMGPSGIYFDSTEESILDTYDDINKKNEWTYSSFFIDGRVDWWSRKNMLFVFLSDVYMFSIHPDDAQRVVTSELFNNGKQAVLPLRVE